MKIEDLAQIDRKPRIKKPQLKFNTLYFIPINVLHKRNKSGHRREGFDVYLSLVWQICKKPMRGWFERSRHCLEKHRVSCDEEDDIYAVDGVYSEMEDLESRQGQEKIIEISD